MSVTLLEEVAAGGTPLAELTHTDPADENAHNVCSLHQQNHEPPPQMPAGFAVGMQLFFTGPSFKASSENWLVHGTQGEVMGPAMSKAFKGKGVTLQFPNNKTCVDCAFSELSRSPPPALRVAACH